MKLPYLKTRKGRAYFELGKPRAEAVGMASSIALGPDGPDAWAKARSLYDEYQTRLKGEHEKAALEDRLGGWPQGSFGAFYHAWKKTEDFAIDKKARTQAEYDEAWRHIGPVFGRTLVTKITVSDSETFHRRCRKELTPRQAWSTLKIWRALLAVLEKKHILPRAPIGAVTNPRPQGRAQFWLEADMQRLVRACSLAERISASKADKRLWKAMGLAIRLAWDTALSPPDVRTFAIGMLLKDRDGFYLERARTKTMKQTQPPVSADLAADLLAYRDELKADGIEILPGLPLFRHREGGVWTHTYMAHQFNRIRRAAFGPEEKRQFQDIRRSANLEADLGGATAEDRASLLANALDRNPGLDATYTPPTVAAGRKANKAREQGRQLLKQELGRQTP